MKTRLMWPKAIAIGSLLLLGLGIAIKSQEMKPEIRQALDAGDTTKAIGLLTQEIQKDKTYHLNYAILGEIYYKRDDYKKAEENLRQALDIKAKDLESMYWLGLTDVALAEQGDTAKLAEAEKMMDDGRKKAKDPADKGRFEDGYGQVMMARHRYQDADKAFRQALVADSSNALYHVHLGNANFKQQIPSLAVAEYQKALQSDTGSTEVYYQWAEACLEMKDYNCALEKLRVVLQKDSTHAPAWMRAGSIYFKAARSAKTKEDATEMYKNAIGSYKRYVELSNAKPDSSTVRVFFELAMSDMALGGYQEAADNFQKVLSIPYEPKDIYLNYGRALMKLGRMDEAGQMMQKHLEWVQKQGSDYTGGPGGGGPELYASLGDALFYSKPPDYAKAIEYYQKVLETDSTNPRVLQNIALCYHQTKQYGQALAYYDKRIAQGVDSSGAGIYRNAAFCALELGRGGDAGDENAGSQPIASTDTTVAAAPKGNYYQMAADYLTKYVQYNPTDAKSIMLLAQTEMSLKNCAAAVGHYQQLLKLDPNDCGAKRAIGFSYFGGKEVGCPGDLDKGLEYLKAAWDCSGGGCKDPQLALWIAQAYNTRAANETKTDKAASKADYKAAFDWYGKVLQCQPGNKDAKTGQDNTRYEF